MSKTSIPAVLREQVLEDADRMCGYCLAPETWFGDGLHIDHIVPESKDGPTIRANLWAACSRCHRAKRDTIEGIDPATGAIAPLFNPRTQLWPAHFRWSTDGIEVEGLTPEGRVTVAMLKLNDPIRVATRANWLGNSPWQQPHR